MIVLHLWMEITCIICSVNATKLDSKLGIKIEDDDHDLNHSGPKTETIRKIDSTCSPLLHRYS